MAFAQIDNAMPARLAKADHRTLARAHRMERAASATARRREVRGEQFSNSDSLPLGSMHHPIGNELTQSLFVRLLELTAAAGVKMPTGWYDMVRTRRQHAIHSHDVTRDAAWDMSSRCGDAVAFGGYTQDRLGTAQRNDAIAVLTACASCLAVKAEPAIRAASLCSHTPSSAAREGLP